MPRILCYCAGDMVMSGDNGVSAMATVDLNGTVQVPGGTATVAIAAGTSGATLVKNGPGRLSRVLVTQAGTGSAVNIYDGTTASGTVIAVIAATDPAGSFLEFDMPAASGITVAGSSTGPALTVSYC